MQRSIKPTRMLSVHDRLKLQILKQARDKEVSKSCLRLAQSEFSDTNTLTGNTPESWPYTIQTVKFPTLTILPFGGSDSIYKDKVELLKVGPDVQLCANLSLEEMKEVIETHILCDGAVINKRLVIIIRLHGDKDCYFSNDFNGSASKIRRELLTSAIIDSALNRGYKDLIILDNSCDNTEAGLSFSYSDWPIPYWGDEFNCTCPDAHTVVIVRALDRCGGAWEKRDGHLTENPMANLLIGASYGGYECLPCYCKLIQRMIGDGGDKYDFLRIIDSERNLDQYISILESEAKEKRELEAFSEVGSEESFVTFGVNDYMGLDEVEFLTGGNGRQRFVMSQLKQLPNIGIKVDCACGSHAFMSGSYADMC